MGRSGSRPVRFGLRADGGVVAADAVDEVPLLVFNAFAGLDHSDVPIPKIRDGADDELGLTVRAVRAEGSRVRGRPRIEPTTWTLRARRSSFGAVRKEGES